MLTSNKLNIGDRVKGNYGGGEYVGTVVGCYKPHYYIKRDDGKAGAGIHIPGYGNAWAVTEKDGIIYSDCEHGKPLQLLETIKTKDMNIKEKFTLALTKEPQKSFRKAGITNGDDILTDDGTKVFLSWLLHNKYAEEFKKDVVDDMLKEDK